MAQERFFWPRAWASYSKQLRYVILISIWPPLSQPQTKFHIRFSESRIPVRWHSLRANILRPSGTDSVAQPWGKRTGVLLASVQRSENQAASVKSSYPPAHHPFWQCPRGRANIRPLPGLKSPLQRHGLSPSHQQSTHAIAVLIPSWTVTFTQAEITTYTLQYVCGRWVIFSVTTLWSLPVSVTSSNIHENVVPTRRQLWLLYKLGAHVCEYLYWRLHPWWAIQ